MSYILHHTTHISACRNIKGRKYILIKNSKFLCLDLKSYFVAISTPRDHFAVMNVLDRNPNRSVNFVQRTEAKFHYTEYYFTLHIFDTF